MRLAEIQAFVAVVRAGNFTAAANRLGVPKSTLSRQVTRLEDHLGARLLGRSTRRIAMTELGKAFYERCNAAIAELEETERIAAGMTARAQGTLRVSMPFEIGQDHVISLLNEFHATYPDIHIVIDVSNRHVDLDGDGFDVALRAGAVRQEGLIARKVIDSEVGLFASRTYLKRRGRPRTWSELSEHDVIAIGPRAEGRPWRLVGPEGEVELTRPAWLQANAPGVVKAAVLADLGIGLGVFDPYLPLFDDGTLVRVLPEYRPSSPGGVFVVYPSRRHLTPKVRVFVDFVIERLPGLMLGKSRRR